jgi:hypothetical protein
MTHSTSEKESGNLCDTLSDPYDVRCSQLHQLGLKHLYVDGKGWDSVVKFITPPVYGSLTINQSLLCAQPANHRRKGAKGAMKADWAVGDDLLEACQPLPGMLFLLLIDCRTALIKTRL